MILLKRLDGATAAGILLAGAGLFLGLKHEGLHWSDMARLTGALVVLGGTAGASLISIPFSQVKRCAKDSPRLLKQGAESDGATIDRLIALSRAVRQRGAAALEAEAKLMDASFLKRAVSLLADGVPRETIQEILDADLEGQRIEAEGAAAFFENAAGYAPTLGLAGAALGLIHVLRNVDTIDIVAKGVAEGFVSILYGVLLANLFLLPIATKLRNCAESRLRLCRLITIGVLAMESGLNPYLIRAQLESFAQAHDKKDQRPGSRRAAA